MFTSRDHRTTQRRECPSCDSVTRRRSIFIVYGGKFSLKYYLSCTNCSLLAKVNNCDKIVTSGRHLTKSPKIETNPLVAPRPARLGEWREKVETKVCAAEISHKALLRHYAKLAPKHSK